jgi:hypothetical protein
MPQWPVPAVNAILVSGEPLFFEYEAYDTIYPGYAVSLDDALDDWYVRRCTAEGVNVIGIADLAQASQTGRGTWRKYDCNDESDDSDRDLPYLQGDQVKVISGSITVMLVLCASQQVKAGTKLQCCDGSPGMVQEYLCVTATPCGLIAEAMEDMTTGVGECAYIHAKLLI